MKRYSMEAKVNEIGEFLPDGRTVNQSIHMGGSYNVLQVSTDGLFDTVFSHVAEANDEPEDIFWGLVFTSNPENAKHLRVCVRSCAKGSFFPDCLSEFQKPEKLWDGCYRVKSLNNTYMRTYYLRVHP